MYQAPFNSPLCFQRNAPDKLFSANIKKGSNSVNTGDIVMVLVFCNFLHGPLSVYRFIKLPSILLEICSGQKYYGRTDWNYYGKRKCYGILALGGISCAIVWSFVVMNLTLSAITYKISKSVTLTMRS